MLNNLALLLITLLYFSYDYVSGKSRTCCVSRCKNRHGKRHRFPKKEPEMFSAWLDRIKPNNYEVLSTTELDERYVICEDHFTPDCIVPGRRGLKRTAIPSLNIPGFQPSETGGAVPYKCSKLELEDRIVENPAVSLPGPSKVEDMLCEDIAEPSASTSFAQTESSTSDLAMEIESSLSIPRHIVVSKGLSRKSILGKVNVTRAADLSPKAKRFYHTPKKWSVNMAEKQKRITSYKERLRQAEKLTNTTNFSNLLKYVNNPTYNFIMCQVRNQNLKAKARRYTMEEKILALSLFKGSGKGYKLLNKIFSLPSTKTLTNVLQKIPFYPGLNKHIFNSLKASVEKMKGDRERCVSYYFKCLYPL